MPTHTHTHTDVPLEPSTLVLEALGAETGRRFIVNLVKGTITADRVHLVCKLGRCERESGLSNTCSQVATRGPEHLTQQRQIPRRSGPTNM